MQSRTGPASSSSRSLLYVALSPSSRRSGPLFCSLSPVPHCGSVAVCVCLHLNCEQHLCHYPLPCCSSTSTDTQSLCERGRGAGREQRPCPSCVCMCVRKDSSVCPLSPLPTACTSSCCICESVPVLFSLSFSRLPKTAKQRMSERRTGVCALSLPHSLCANPPPAVSNRTNQPRAPGTQRTGNDEKKENATRPVKKYILLVNNFCVRKNSFRCSSPSAAV